MFSIASESSALLHVDERRLVGIVSIGDVVKSPLDELEQQSKALSEYIGSA